MTGFALLDVAIGAVFAILAFSLAATALQEAFAAVLNWRGRVLRRGIYRLLESEEVSRKLVGNTRLPDSLKATAALTNRFLAHPLIRSLHGPKTLPGAIADVIGGEGVGNAGRLPSAIPETAFAKALMEVLKALDDAKAETPTVDSLRGKLDDATAEVVVEAEAALTGASAAIDRLPMDKRLREKLKAAVTLLDTTQDEIVAELENAGEVFDRATAEGLRAMRARIAEVEADIEATITAAQTAVADWFDQSMDRVSGWYVRRAKYMLFAIGAVLACVLNFDLIGYSGQLIKDEDLRNRIVERAELAAKAGAVGELSINPPGMDLRIANQIDSDRDGLVSNGELEAALGTMAERDRRFLGLGEPSVTQIQRKAASKMLTEALSTEVKVDADGDGEITEEEADKAIDRTLNQIESRIGVSIDALNKELGDQGAKIGRTCEDSETWGACVLRQWSWPAFISWILIGIGCTLGGQFWFDMLRNLLRVRTAATGVRSKMEKITG